MYFGPLFKKRFIKALKELQNNMWQGGPPPYRDGRCVIVELATEAQEFQPEGLKGKPVIVVCDPKLMITTLRRTGQDIMRFEYDAKTISRWRELELTVPE